MGMSRLLRPALLAIALLPVVAHVAVLRAGFLRPA